MIKQAIIPLAGLGTRLLPLTSVLAKELLPINGKPVIEYILDECIDAGINEIIFIISIFAASSVSSSAKAARGKTKLKAKINDRTFLTMFETIQFGQLSRKLLWVIIALLDQLFKLSLFR